MFLALLRPSRGLLFAESEQSCWEELRDIPHVRCSTWNKKIPDSFNDLTAAALIRGATHVLFVEEDTVIPSGGLQALLGMDADIASIDYPLKVDGRRSIGTWPDGRHWCSLGCTLIRRKVFDRLPVPWFRTDLAVASIYDGSHGGNKYCGLVQASNDANYGGQDAYLCFTAQEAGFTIASVPGMRCKHLRLDALGRPDNNDGCHKISAVEAQFPFS